MLFPGVCTTGLKSKEAEVCFSLWYRLSLVMARYH